MAPPPASNQRFVQSGSAEAEHAGGGVSALGVIPARYASSRFPGKALADLNGKPLIQWVWERAKGAKKLDRLLVATDDERIKSAARAFGADVVMTDSDLPSGTDRVWEAAKTLEAEVVVNIQGDEPFLDPAAVDQLIEALEQDPDSDMATLCVPMKEEAGYRDPNVVKVEMDLNGRALYFSRASLPGTKKEGQMPTVWYKHIGLYAYRRSFLEQFVAWPVSSLEKTEQLEQLRALEHGARIRLVSASRDTVGVDTLEDLKQAEDFINKESLK